MKIKKNDKVQIIAGKDKGKKGTVEKVFLKEKKVLISGINVYKKHLKSRRDNKPGGIIDITKPLAVCKIAFICPKCKQISRIGYKKINNDKKRQCRKCEEILD